MLTCFISTKKRKQKKTNAAPNGFQISSRVAQQSQGHWNTEVWETSLAYLFEKEEDALFWLNYESTFV